MSSGPVRMNMPHQDDDGDLVEKLNQIKIKRENECMVEFQELLKKHKCSVEIETTFSSIRNPDFRIRFHAQ